MRCGPPTWRPTPKSLIIGRQIDFRVACQPTIHGENIVLRILDREKGVIPLEGLELPDDSMRLLKIMMASSMLDIETFSRIIDGDNGSALVAARNAHAVGVLQERIAEGDRQIAIFYGAAHLPDFVDRLISEVGLQPLRTDWVDAWDLRPVTSIR